MENYRHLFLQSTPMIDTRAPVEFARGAFPGAVNLPLMSDAERAQVGTCYKQRGQEAAIRLGHRLVSGPIKTARVEAWADFVSRNPEGCLYCFRGGLRSQICQQWLAEAGVEYPRVVGGYKAMRNFLSESLEQACSLSKLVLLAGSTGAAKTALLGGLANSVDLEGLAHHRGSAFGRRVGGQPTQIDFENALAIELLRRQDPQHAGPVVLEDEGRFIGQCALPLPLQQAMTQAPVVVLHADLEDRVEHSFKNYILDNLVDWQKQEGDAAGFASFCDDLRQSMGKLRRRLGNVRFMELNRLLEDALQSHAGGDEEAHRAWIRILLRDYYDPMYRYQLEQKAHRIIFRGTADEVRQYLGRL